MKVKVKIRRAKFIFLWIIIAAVLGVLLLNLADVSAKGQWGALIGRVHELRTGNKVIIATASAGRYRPGMRIQSYAVHGPVVLFVEQAYHTNIHCRVAQGNVRWLQKGMELYEWREVKEEPPKAIDTGKPGQTKKVGRYTYVDNGDGTVTNTTLALVWKKCSQGQNNDASCSGQAKKYQYCTENTNDCDNDKVLTSGPAYNACDELNKNGGFAGRTTWRVPTKEELKTLVYCSQGPNAPLDDFKDCNDGYNKPTIDTALFPHSVAGDYWSSSTSVSSTTYAWFVHFSCGVTLNDGKENSSYVRYVSSRP